MLMPYKDPEKQRKSVREAVAKYREKEASIYKMGLMKIIAWMQRASQMKKGERIEVILARVQGTEQWFPVPVLSRESFVRELEKYNFSYAVEVVDKKFWLSSEEGE